MGGEWIRQSTRRGRSVVDDRSLMNDLSSEECDEELAGIVGKFLLALGTSGMQLNLSACPGGGCRREEHRAEQRPSEFPCITW